MHLTSVLLLGASSLALTAPVFNLANTRTKTDNENVYSERQDAGLSALTGLLGVGLKDLSSLPAGVGTAGLKEFSKKRHENIDTQQLADLGALEGILGPLLVSLGSVTGGAGAAPEVLGGVLKTRDADDIGKRQLEALGALSGLLGPLSGALAPLLGGVLKRKYSGALPNDELEARQPIEIDEVTTLLGSLSSILGTVEGLGGALKREEDGTPANEEVNPRSVARDLERRQDPVTTILTGLLTTLAPMVGVLTDPIAPIFGGKGWGVKRANDVPSGSHLLGELQSTAGLADLVGEITDPISPLVGGEGYEATALVRKDSSIEALAPLADVLGSSNSLAALVGEATAPIAPLTGGKGYERGSSKRDVDTLGSLGGALGPLSALLGPNALAAIVGQITDPISPLAGGHGYLT